MSEIKGVCNLILIEKGHVTEGLSKDVEYSFTKTMIPKLNEHGYVIINPADPANPIKMRESTFVKYFVEVAEVAEVEEVAKEAIKEAPKKEVIAAKPEIKANPLAMKTEATKVDQKQLTGEMVTSSNPFTGLDIIMEHMDMIQSITFTPNEDKNLTFTVVVKPDIIFSVTGVPVKIIAEAPEMLCKVFSLESKVKALADLIDRRIELEKAKEMEEKAAKAVKKIVPAKAAAPAKKEEPKEDAKTAAKTLFNQSKPEAEPMDETNEEEAIDAEEVIDADKVDEWS